MMLKRLRFSKFLFLCWAVLLGCDRLQPTDGGDMAADGVVLTICDPETYELACIQDENTATSDGLIDVLGEMKDAVVGAAGEPVSAAREDEYGESSKAEITREFPIIEDHPEATMLKGIMRKLLKQRSDPSGIDYNIYVIRADVPNAFTLGGEIFVTNVLLEQAESKDELACVIGHEIGHNELGHIARKIQEQELAAKALGAETGAMVANIVGLLTIGFNQRLEAESDLYGIDLALSAGYDACRGIDFWKRLSTQEGPANDWDNFTRSHPYSSRRATCYRSHIADQHHYTCEN